MKTMNRIMFLRGILGVAGAIAFWATGLSAAVFTNANVAADLTNTTRWVGGVVPGATAVALWDSTLSTAAYATNATGYGQITWKGIQILNPAAAVYITNNSQWFILSGDGGAGSGIDMSQATVDLTIDGSAANQSLILDGTASTVTVANARTLSLINTSGQAVNLRPPAVTLTGSGGTVAFKGNWWIGSTSGTGILNVASGVLWTNTGNNYVSVGYAVPGIVNQSGGNAGLYQLYVGNTRAGAYNLSGGTLQMANSLLVGVGAGAGALKVSGGTLVQASSVAFHVGNNGASGSGQYIQSGSSVVTAGIFRVAGNAGGVGNFTLSNGTFYAASWDTLAATATSTGHVSLAGGTAILPARTGTKLGYADFTFDGGTLQAPATSTTYLQGFDRADLTTHGAVLDTAGFDITVSQTLENAAGQAGTLTKTGLGTLTFAGANTYSGNTTISNGVLKIAGSGSISNSAVINVAVASATCDVSAVSGGWTVLSNQTLTGLGVVTGTVVTVVSNGVIAPGAAGTAGGILTIRGTNTFLNGAKLNLDYNGATIDTLVVNGVLNLPANMTLSLSGSGGFTKLTVMSCNSLSMASTNFTGWTISGGPSGLRAVYDNAGHIQLVRPTGAVIMLQ